MRPFGGYNLLFFGDSRQLPPIPFSAALFIPSPLKKQEVAQAMINMFWGDGLDAINFFKELSIQERVADAWYNIFLQQCRQGNLTEEMYNYLMGLPTEHSGSWLPSDADPIRTACGNAECR